MDLSQHWIILCFSLVVGSIVIFNVVFYFIVRKYIHFDILKKHHDLAGFVITTLGVLYTVFLGLTVVNAQNQKNEISSRVNEEAYLAANLIRFVSALPEQQKIQVQQGIKGYLKSVVEDEWLLMGLKQESPKTLEKLEEFWAPLYEYRPSNVRDRLWFSQCLEILTKFNSARLERIYTSWESLGSISWAVVIVGALVIISLLLFFGTENLVAQFIMNSLFVGYFAFMIYAIYSFDNPFNPPQAITPKAYEVVYNYYTEEPNEHKSPEEIELLKHSAQ